MPSIVLWLRNRLLPFVFTLWKQDNDNRHRSDDCNFVYVLNGRTHGLFFCDASYLQNIYVNTASVHQQIGSFVANNHHLYLPSGIFIQQNCVHMYVYLYV